MNEYINNLTEMLGPVASGKLAHAIIGLLILVVGLFVVKILAGIFSRMLKKVNWLYRTNTDGSITDLASPIASLIKAVLTIFVLMAVLQHFGLTDVLAPLKDMVTEITSALPNIIGAGIIIYAGWIIAKIVSQIVAMALGKFDEKLAEKTGNDEIKVSAFGSALVLFAILLPIVVSALGVLNIPAISVPASAMIEKLMAAVPNIIGAGIILLVAYLVTKFVIHMLNTLLEGMHVNSLPEKIGVQGLFTESFTVTRLIGAAIMFFAMLSASTAAINLLGIDVISSIFAKVIEFGGGILIGSIILFIGYFLSNLAYTKLLAGTSAAIANIARFAILGLVLAMGLKSMGLADNIVNMAFGFTIGGVAVAMALAFGLGGKDAAKAITDSWASRIINK
ncbi:MAG: mechanosensitive ion channel [Gammaproteobacteria bacterium]|nr:mechanosensitive ion channel [Gammaproteobacteria bacterium]MDH3856629.1 mechanosensitive ion channel [Gammaproteobacteria bacterium]